MGIFNGTKIKRVVDCSDNFKEYKVSVKVDKNLVENFDLSFGNKTLYVLDNYGNGDLSWLPDCFYDRFFPRDEYTLGVDVTTGDIYCLRLSDTPNEVFVNLLSNHFDGCGYERRAYRVTRKFLNLIRSINTKRPWSLAVDREAFVDFFEREASYYVIEDFGIVVILNFKSFTVEVHPLYGCRVVNDWDDSALPEEN